jgi:hypothetical protein
MPGPCAAPPSSAGHGLPSLRALVRRGWRHGALQRHGRRMEEAGGAWWVWCVWDGGCLGGPRGILGTRLARLHQRPTTRVNPTPPRPTPRVPSPRTPLHSRAEPALIPHRSLAPTPVASRAYLAPAPPATPAACVCRAVGLGLLGGMRRLGLGGRVRCGAPSELSSASRSQDATEPASRDPPRHPLSPACPVLPPPTHTPAPTPDHTPPSPEPAPAHTSHGNPAHTPTSTETVE